MAYNSVKIEGNFYDGQSSAAHHAILVIGQAKIWLETTGKTIELELELLTFCQPIGNITRSVSWQNYAATASFQTNDIIKFDKFYNRLAKKKPAKILHKLEKHIWVVVVALVISIFAIYAYVTFAVPALSKVIARYVPLNLYEYTSVKTLAILDETLFDPPKTPSSKQQRIRKKFNIMVKDLKWTSGFNLQFRAMGQHGKMPNAFALPSGIIIVTDGLVDIADNDAEILAILAHEVGHVVERHGITAMVETSILTLSVTFITGELSGTSEILINNSVLLTQMSYGRALEKQADIFGKNLIIEQSIGDAQLLVNMLNKMSVYYGQNPSQESDMFSGYLSSHPMTSEREKYLIETKAQHSN